jgi:hypothetical protein
MEIVAAQRVQHARRNPFMKCAIRTSGVLICQAAARPGGGSIPKYVILSEAEEPHIFPRRVRFAVA